MGTLAALAQIALVAYAPGAMLFRAPWGDRDRRAALSAEERVFWGIVLSVAMSLAFVLALAAAGMYTLGRLLALDAILVAGILARARGDIRLERSARLAPTALLPLLIVALGVWLYFPTAEYVMGGKDPGVYMSEGIQIAQRGTLSIHDEVVASVPSSFRDLFFARMDGRPYYGIRFMGFFLFDPSSGYVVGQFPHLFPASIAVAYGIAGLDGARSTVALWTILGLLAVYFASARLIGRAAALVATGLLAVNVIEVWYGRYPNTEVVLQVLLFAGLLAVDRALCEGDRWFEVVGGGLLGLALFLRFDSVLAIVAVMGVLALASIRGHRLSWRFFAVLAVAGALAGWYLLDLLVGYAHYPFGFIDNLAIGQKLLLVALAGVALFLFVSGHRWRRALRRLPDAVPALMSALLVVLAMYAFFFRHPEGTLAIHDAYALRTFAWYVSAPGLFAVVLAVALLVPRLFWRSPTFFAAAMTFSAFFFYKIRAVPEHFWMTRRFLPVILPASLIMTAALVVACASPDGAVARRLQRWWPESGGAPNRRVRRRAHLAVAAVAFALVGALAATFWRAAAPIRGHVEYAGMIGHLSRILAKSEPDDLLVVEARARSDMHVLALPLAYIYGRDVLVLASGRVESELLGGFVAWALDRYKNVYFLGRGQPLLSKHLGLRQVWSDVFWVPEYESPSNAYPVRVKLKEFRYQQCRLMPAAFASAPVVPLDDVHLVNFHETEQDQRGSWRWTQGASEVLLTNIDTDTTAVSISMEDGGRPAGASPAVVEVTLADRPLGRVLVDQGAKPYEFPVSNALARELASSSEPARLRIAVRPWTPREFLGTADDRELGVMVSHIEVIGAPRDARGEVSSPVRNN